MAVTINYLYPTAGAAPSGVNSGNTVIATIVAGASTDLSALVTHAFNLSTTDNSSGFAMTVFAPQGDETTSAWYETSVGPNFSCYGKNNVAVGPLTKVFIKRVHSIDR